MWTPSEKNLKEWFCWKCKLHNLVFKKIKNNNHSYPISFRYYFRDLKYFLQLAANFAVKVLFQIRCHCWSYDWHLVWHCITKFFLRQGLSLANQLNYFFLKALIHMVINHLIAYQQLQDRKEPCFSNFIVETTKSTPCRI